MNPRPFSPILFVLLLATSMAARADALLIVEEALRAEPARNAESAARLPARMRVEIVEERGGWVQVRAAGMQGWVRRIVLRIQAGAGGPQYHGIQAVNEVRQVVSIAGIRQPPSTLTPLRLTRAAPLCDLPEECEAPLLAPGEPASLVEARGEWLLVERGDGQGWLRAAAACVSAPAAAQGGLAACPAAP